jgi:hypothetical protein
MEQSDDPKKVKTPVADSDYFEDTPPKGNVGKLIQALLTRYSGRDEDLPVDLLLKTVDIHEKYQKQLKIEIESRDKLGTKFNHAKLEDMFVEREDSLRKINLESVKDDLKLMEPGLVKKKIEEFHQQGIRLRRYQDYSTTVMTVKGPVDYSRIALRPATSEDKIKLKQTGHHGYIFPLDIGLGLSKLPHRMTIDTMLAIANLSATSISFEDTEQFLKEKTSIITNDDTIRAVTNELGSLIYANDVKEADEITEKFFAHKFLFPAVKRPHTLYLECDGAMVATRKNKDQQKSHAEQAKGAIWKENKLGVAFSTDNLLYYKSASGKLCHIIQKRGYTSLIGNCKDFSKLMLSLAIQNGFGLYEKTVLITDGAEWIKNMKEEYFGTDVIHILDFYHLKEHVFEYAKEIFDHNEHKYEPWANDIIDLFKASKSDEVIEKINKLSKSQRKKANNDLLEYIDHNKSIINYLEYKRQGFFIGSGAIESGNKVVLQRRLKQGAMRWNIASAQALLSLISKLKSGLWGQVVDLVYKHYAGAEQEAVKKRVGSLFNINSPANNEALFVFDKQVA